MPPRAAVGCLVLLSLAAGCAPPQQSPASRASAAAVASCRASTNRSFDRQNRYLLSERDTRDTPFSTSGTPGITTRGLTERYDYDTQLAGCLAASKSPAAADSSAASSQPPAHVDTSSPVF